MANILIVDDSPAIRKQVRSALETAGHNVVEAEHGQEGLDKIVSMTPVPDLLISDYNMPGIDGLTMIIKANEAIGQKKFPILMLTTETSEKLKTLGKENGVTGWITKPFAPELFIGAVTKVLSLKK